ncbi:MAG: hypothetical protein QOE31_3943 [Solirubrobacteraceae bacterium]|jgi:hypothetical protein|nr:hypothetical protein [Solirubrobacteraceae bacterium]
MERKELETAAATNAHLRGLIAVPVGGLMMLAALGNWEVGPLRHGWVFAVCALAIIATCAPIARYYNEHYGRASASTRQQTRTAVSVVVAVPLVIGLSALLNSNASWSLDLPVNPIAISLALVMLMTYAVNAGVRTHHAIVFGALLAAGFVPLWPPSDVGDTANIGLVMAGAAVIVAGLLDHRLLVRALGPARGLRVEGGNAGA